MCVYFIRICVLLEDDMDFISVREVASKWEISERRVQRLCEDGRIEGIERFGRSWMIPKDAEKPNDLRKQRLSKNKKAVKNHVQSST